MPNLMQDSSIRDFSITIVKSILENKILRFVVKNTRKTKGTQLKNYNREWGKSVHKCMGSICFLHMQK